ncbi:FHA domain-containing protein [Arthrobacter sp. JSM 101049]|uniref:FHA domain-containing protein n=1 Tax=Arthrobacter sp. JSM 101049 TaxID=929097 RepID=UPI003562EBA2
MSNRITYQPGPWLALVRHGHLVLLPEGTDPGHVQDLWEALQDAPSVETLLSAVLSARGLALTGMDPFGLVSLESDVHTILRGPVSLAAEGRELSTHVNGHGVTTWMERRIPRQESLDIALDDVLRKNDGGAPPWLPIVEGIIPFGRLHVDLPEEQPGEIEPLSAPQPIVEPTVAEPAAPPAAGAPAPVGSADAEDERSVEPFQDEPDPESGQEPDTRTDDGPEAEPAPEPDSEPERDADPEPTPDSELEPDSEPEEPQEAAPEAGSDNGAGADGDADPTGGDAGVSVDDADDANTILSAAAYTPAPAVVPAPVPPAPVAAEDEPVSDDTIAGPHTTDEELPDPEELIDAVPWLAAARAQDRAEEQAGTPDDDQAEATDDQPTIASAPAQPATDHAAGTGRPGGASRAPDRASGQPVDGDHDGDTVMRGDLPTQVLPATPPASGTGHNPSTGPQVLGRLCPAGHANPPTSSSCATCGAGLNEEPLEVPRPSLGRMVISGGETVELDRPAVVGRQPSVSRSASGSMPRVVQVKSPSGDISRSHLEVQLEGWHVMLLDLKATNGTLLVRSGMPPRRLGHGEKLMLLDGDIADLGDGVSLRFEGLL